MQVKVSVCVCARLQAPKLNLVQLRAVKEEKKQGERGGKKKRWVVWWEGETKVGTGHKIGRAHV